MRPVVCLVTAPVSGEVGEDALVRRAEAAAHAGAHLIQIRQPHLEARALMRLVERTVLATRGSRARIVVNDRLDVALAAGAHGVHLRGNSIAAARVRHLVPTGFTIGRSVHSVAEAQAAEAQGGLDYLLFGTVFATASKPGVAPAGKEALAAACHAVSLPVLAIGGMTLATLPLVARADAAGFAAIGIFEKGDADSMAEVIRRAGVAFDTPPAVP